MNQQPNVRDAKHWLGFLISGGLAFAIDATTTKLLTSIFGVPVLASRIVGISLAMIAGWLAHRQLTFRLATPPTLHEFLKYAGVAWVAAAINYAIFAAIIFIYPTIEPLIALAISSIIAMAAAYLGMRFGAFKSPRP